MDVKKPGPPFDEPKIASESNDLPGKLSSATNIKNGSLYGTVAELKTKNTILPSMMKKEPRGAHPNPSRDIYDVDTDYVYVKFKNR